MLSAELVQAFNIQHSAFSIVMEQQDVERIARATLKELGLPAPDLAIHMDEPGHWRIDIRGNVNGPSTLKIRCGQGSTAQWVRTQIFDQYNR
jgi:hypothetical protein